MSTNCYLKKFKGVANNPNLEKYDTLVFNIVASGSWSSWDDTKKQQASVVRIIASSNIEVDIVDGSGYFGSTYSNVESEHKTHAEGTDITMYFANVNCKVEVSNRHAITSVNIGSNWATKALASVSIKELSKAKALTTAIIYGSAYGDVSLLKNHPALTRCNFINSVDVTGDVTELTIGRFSTQGTKAYGDFTGLLEVATNSGDSANMMQVICPEDKVVSADFSKANSNAAETYAPGSSATKDIIGRWTTTRSSDKNIINFASGSGSSMVVDFGDDVNPMLVNQAACTVPSSGSKNMNIKGNYNPNYTGMTAAIATLKAAGYNITINGETL